VGNGVDGGGLGGDEDQAHTPDGGEVFKRPDDDRAGGGFENTRDPDARGEYLGGAGRAPADDDDRQALGEESGETRAHRTRADHGDAARREGFDGVGAEHGEAHSAFMVTHIKRRHESPSALSPSATPEARIADMIVLYLAAGQEWEDGRHRRPIEER